MTMMIPKECLDTNSVTQEFHQNLYDQLGPKYKVIQRLKNNNENQTNSTLEGSLYWIQFKQQSLFIYLSDAPADFFEASTNDKLIKNRVLNSPELLAIMRLQNSLLPKVLQKHKASLTPFIMVFNNIENNKLNIGIKSVGISLLGEEQINISDADSNQAKLHELVQKFIGEPVSKNVYQHIRYQFNPELSVTPYQANQLTLDNEQEIAIKSGMLKPNNESRFVHLNLRSIHGDTNSGKTEAILQRVKLINQSPYYYQKDKVLVLAPNDVSSESLHQRYARLNPDDKDTEILSLNQWCITQLKSPANIMDDDEEAQLIDTIITPILTRHKINRAVFLQEIDFILSRTFDHFNDYLHAIRSEKPTLKNKQHKEIWKAIQTLISKASPNSMLSAEPPQLLFNALIQNKTLHAQYDHILIDDAHMLPPIAFEIMKKVLKPKTGQLFISQNPNHYFVNSYQLWKETSLDLRSNCTVLMHNYRINPYILNAANVYHLKRLPDISEHAIHRNLPNMAINPMPQLLHFHSEKDERSRLIDKIKRLIHSGTALDDILLIAPNNQSALYFKKLLNVTLEIPVTIIKNSTSPKSNNKPQALRICELSNIYGHSASHSFIVSIQKLYEAEDKLTKQSDEYKALFINNTHYLSMAMCSAKKDLTLFITIDTIPKEFINLHINIPTMHSKHFAEVCTLHG